LTDATNQSTQIAFKTVWELLMGQAIAPAANTSLSIDEHQLRGMNELIPRSHLRTWIASHRLFELFSDNPVDGLFFAGEEEPALGISSTSLCILIESP